MDVNWKEEAIEQIIHDCTIRAKSNFIGHHLLPRREQLRTSITGFIAW